MVKVQLLLLRFRSIAYRLRATRLRTTRALLPNDTRSATIKLTQLPKQGVPKASDLLRHGRRAKERRRNPVERRTGPRRRRRREQWRRRNARAL